MACAESLPPPRLSPRVSGGCDPASLCPAVASGFSDALESCALVSDTFGGAGAAQAGGPSALRLSSEVRFGGL